MGEAMSDVSERGRDDGVYARLVVTAGGNIDPHSDLIMVSEALDGVISGVIRSCLIDSETEIELFRRAREIILHAARARKARVRFRPDFADSLTSQDAVRGGFDPFDPLDAAMEFGINAWMRRVILQEDRYLYDELYSFARLTRLTKASPFLLELTILAAGAVLLPAILVVGVLRAVASADRHTTNNAIGTAEAGSKQEEFKQRELQTEIMGYLRDEVRDRHRAGEQLVSDGVMTAIATITSPAVRELKSSPLIEKINIGFSASR
jgi:hypothetical protein